MASMLARHPSLRPGVSHGGGTFAMVEPRLTHAWRQFPELQEIITQAPRDQAPRIFYDNLVYDGEVLGFLLNRFGVEKLMIGTDAPYRIRETAPLSHLSKLGLSDRDYTRLCSENARSFLNWRDRQP